MNIKKLGVTVTDNASSIKGILTIFSLDMGGGKLYGFQPAGLNPSTKEPISQFWLSENRISDSEMVDIDIPVHVLGSQVEDSTTKFKGMAIQLYYHLNGCVHIEVKPKGIIKETGESIKAVEFDIRRLKGIMIKKLSEKELVVSRKEKPSPEIKPMMNRR
jgi:hypothetical protein